MGVIMIQMSSFIYKHFQLKSDTTFIHNSIFFPKWVINQNITSANCNVLNKKKVEKVLDQKIQKTVENMPSVMKNEFNLAAFTFFAKILGTGDICG